MAKGSQSIVCQTTFEELVGRGFLAIVAECNAAQTYRFALPLGSSARFRSGAKLTAAEPGRRRAGGLRAVLEFQRQKHEYTTFTKPGRVELKHHQLCLPPHVAFYLADLVSPLVDTPGKLKIVVLGETSEVAIPADGTIIYQVGLDAENVNDFWVVQTRKFGRRGAACVGVKSQDGTVTYYIWEDATQEEVATALLSFFGLNDLDLDEDGAFAYFEALSDESKAADWARKFYPYQGGASESGMLVRVNEEQSFSILRNDNAQHPLIPLLDRWGSTVVSHLMMSRQRAFLSCLNISDDATMTWPERLKQATFNAKAIHEYLQTYYSLSVVATGHRRQIWINGPSLASHELLFFDSKDVYDSLHTYWPPFQADGLDVLLEKAKPRDLQLVEYIKDLERPFRNKVLHAKTKREDGSAKYTHGGPNGASFIEWNSGKADPFASVGEKLYAYTHLVKQGTSTTFTIRVSEPCYAAAEFDGSHSPGLKKALTVLANGKKPAASSLKLTDVVLREGNRMATFSWNTKHQINAMIFELMVGEKKNYLFVMVDSRERYYVVGLSVKREADKQLSFAKFDPGHDYEVIRRSNGQLDIFEKSRPEQR